MMQGVGKVYLRSYSNVHLPCGQEIGNPPQLLGLVVDNAIATIHEQIKQSQQSWPQLFKQRPNRPIDAMQITGSRNGQGDRHCRCHPPLSAPRTSCRRR